jgi:predicted transposase/invertase (TIGR01784 family)
METKPRLNHLNDVLVKFIFFHEDRKHLTISLINSVFEKEGMPLITDFTFKDRELDPTDCRSKESRVDVLGMCSDGTIIEIEFQLTYFYPMEARSLLYWARLFTLQIPKGGDYKNLKRTVCINILAHSIFNDADTTDYYNAFCIINKHHPNHILTNLLEMYFIELPKWEKVRKTEEMSQLSYWLAYFSSKTSEEELEEMAMNNSAIREALEAEPLFMSNPNLVTAYDQLEKARMDRIAEQDYWEIKLEQAEQKVKQSERKVEQAEQKVKQSEQRVKQAEQEAEESKRSIAKNLLSMNMPSDKVASATGLTIETVESLR